MVKFIDGLIAGLLIALGGGVYLMCENKIFGAIFFGVALLCICIKGYNLFTGKICYIPESHTKDDVSRLLLGLLGNFIAAVFFGYLVAYAVPQMGTAAYTACTAKLAQGAWQTLIRGIMCGVLIYFAVDIYAKNKTPIGIIYCIPVFILSGFEHSIADMFYFGASGIVSVSAIVFILIVIAGNTIGGMLVPVLKMIGAKRCKKKKEQE